MLNNKCIFEKYFYGSCLPYCTYLTRYPSHLNFTLFSRKELSSLAKWATSSSIRILMSFRFQVQSSLFHYQEPVSGGVRWFVAGKRGELSNPMFPILWRAFEFSVYTGAAITHSYGFRISRFKMMRSKITLITIKPSFYMYNKLHFCWPSIYMHITSDIHMAWPLWLTWLSGTCICWQMVPCVGAIN